MYLAPGFLAQVTTPLKDRNVANHGEGRGLQAKARPVTGRVRTGIVRVEGSIRLMNRIEGN